MMRFMRVGRIGAILMLASLLYLALNARCSDQTQDLRQENGSPNLESQTLTGRASELDDEASDGGMLDAGIRMTVSLLMVLAIIAAGVFILKKVSPYRGLAASSGSPISVISKIPLGQKKSICLVRVADEILVIGLTSANVSLLTKMNAEDYYRGDGQATSQDAKQKDKGSFRRLYSTLIHRKEESIAKDKVPANISSINS
jgi:flagellar biosynthetic protein FliO